MKTKLTIPKYIPSTYEEMLDEIDKFRKSPLQFSIFKDVEKKPGGCVSRWDIMRPDFNQVIEGEFIFKHIGGAKYSNPNFWTFIYDAMLDVESRWPCDRVFLEEIYVDEDGKVEYFFGS